jgi:transcriptional regulator with XRE-family HTH domain
MSAERRPNDRLREHRERLGKTQEEMGDHLAHIVWELHRKVVAISGGMVSKWERGERRPSRLYREAYRISANASDEELGFARRRQPPRSHAATALDPTAPQPRAFPPRPHLASRPAKRLYAPQSVDAIRQAMLTPAGTATQDPDTAALSKRATHAWQLRQRARYTTLGEVLPPLLTDAETATAELRGDDRLRAHRALTHAYNATSSVLKRLGDFEFASIAADRAIRAAATVGDPVLTAAASYRLANVFLSAGRLEETRDVALRAAATLEPSLGSSPAQLAMWGALLLTAALAAAQQGAAAPAWELFGAAAVAARQLRHDYVDLHTIFGPANVALHGVQIAAELGDGTETLRRGARVEPERLPDELLERRSHFYVDVARGHAQQADDGAAVATLLQADRLAPEDVRFNPIVRDMVLVLLRRERRSATPGLRELAANIDLN